MTFKIEHGDELFLIFDPDGEPGSPSHYCTFSTVDYQGRVYGAYLTGTKDEDDGTPLDSNDDPVTVYDITDFPTMVPVATVFDEVVFDGETNSKGISLDGKREVDCKKCDGDGFYFEPIPGWIAPPPEEDEEESTIDVSPL